MTDLQKEIYQELMQQGMPKAGCKYIAHQFKNENQEHIMMKYLISIREEHVSVTQVSNMAEQIMEM